MAHLECPTAALIAMCRSEHGILAALAAGEVAAACPGAARTTSQIQTVTRGRRVDASRILLTMVAEKVVAALILVKHMTVVAKNVVVDTPPMALALPLDVFAVRVHQKTISAILSVPLSSQPLATLCLVVIQVLFVMSARTASAVLVEPCVRLRSKVRHLVNVKVVDADFLARIATLTGCAALTAKDARFLIQRMPDVLVATLKV